MIKSYICGAYSAPNKNLILENIETAKKYHIELIRLGFANFCPHMNTAGLEETDIPYETFIQLDLEWLSCAKILFVMPYSEDSKGTQIEIEFARENGIHIFYLPPFQFMFDERIKQDIIQMKEYFESK